MSQATYVLVPFDLNRLLQPGTLSQMFELEDADPAETVMVEMPLDDFLRARSQFPAMARELGRSLVVVMTQEPGRL